MSTLEILIKSIDKKGLLHVAQILGQKTTRNIESWINEKSIPKTKEPMIRRILEGDK